MHRSENRWYCLLALVALWSLTTVAEDPVFSGPQVGEALTAFKVVSVDEKTAGKEIDPIEMAGGKPTLIVFVHKLTRPGVALTRALTGYAKSQAEHGAFGAIIWLQDDKAAAEAYLTRAKTSLNFTVPVGVSVDGGEGPGAYGLNRNVELTILIANENKVTANFALVQPSLTEAGKIASELAQLLDQPAPKQAQLEKLAYGNAAMRRDAKNPAPGNELRSMMRKVLAAGASEADLDTAVKAIDEWVGDDQQRQASLARMATAVLDRGMGSAAAQSVIKKWKAQYGDKKPAGESKEKK